MKRRFAITSLLAAGLFPPQPSAAMPLPHGHDLEPERKPTLFDVFRLNHKFTLAGHRSHSSHASHSSHSSHRSSSGGGYSTYTPPTSLYTLPAPTYTPPTYTPPPTYAPPAALATLPALPGNSDKFKRIVIQVQTALLAYGYYDGAIDGKVGPGTRSAIKQMQTDYGLKVTGTITPQVLDSLRIVAE